MTLGVLTAQATKQSVKYMMGTADTKHQSLIRYLIASSESEVFRSVAALVIAFLTAFKTASAATRLLSFPAFRQRLDATASHRKPPKIHGECNCFSNSDGLRILTSGN